MKVWKISDVVRFIGCPARGYCFRNKMADCRHCGCYLRNTKSNKKDFRKGGRRN